MKIGLFGLPQSGKTTVFAVLTGREVRAADMVRPEAHIGVVHLPDERVDTLSRLYEPQKTTYTEVTFVDTLALRRGGAGAAQAQSLGGQLSDADAFALVVGCFGGAADPVSDLEALLLELALTDLAVLERRLERLEKERRGGRKDHAAEYELLQRCREQLEAGGLLRALEFSEDEDTALRGFALLTQRPMLVVANVAEEQAAAAPAPSAPAPLGPLAACTRESALPVVSLAAGLELELAALAGDDQAEIMAGYGIAELARGRFIRACFELLDLVVFFTANQNEVRAWTLPRGSTALAAAGKVHTDMARGFQGVDVLAFETLGARGSMAECRKQGGVRREGRDYAVQDGDILYIHFSA